MMNVFRLYIWALMVLVSGCGPAKKRTESEEAVSKKDSIVAQKFSSAEFGISFDYPDNWKTKVSEIGNSYTIINIYPAESDTSPDLPLNIHESANLSYISIFPGGYGTELPSGKNRRIDQLDKKPVPFEVDRQESLVFFLENNQVWSYFIVPSSPPSGWSPNGFLFAQVAVNEFKVRCYDEKTGEELEMSECNPLEGDSVVRYGEVFEKDLQTIKRILDSFKFRENTNEQQMHPGNNASGIKVVTPQPGSVITSPLKITGEAKGSWFFEALLEIELQKNGTTLASTTGKAQGNWMTQDYVDFKSELKFPEVKETGKAELVFRNSNPSGKKELEKAFKLPVVIGK